jgi:Rha family phage regulatory protein
MQDLVIVTTDDITKSLPITTSRIIADKFGKRHDNVIQKIKSLVDDDSVEFFSALEIKEAEYIDSQGKPRKEYHLNRDQFVFVVMGFTGKKANKFKAEFIKRFNFMERELLARVETRAIAKQVRHSLTDSISDHLDDNTMHKKFAYSNYTKLVYKKVLGATVKKYKEKHRIPVNANVRDYLSIEQLEGIQCCESKIASYIEALKTVLSDKEIYEKVKEII